MLATALAMTTANSPANRLAALLTPDAVPECASGAEFITTVVSGATTMAIPSDMTSTGTSTPAA